MVFRELTIDDVKDMHSIKGSLFDILAATAERAKEIYENEESTKKRETTTRRKRSRERKRFSDEDGSGSSSSASASKKRKYNPPKRKDNRPEQPPPPLPEEVKKAIEEMAGGRNSVTPAKLVIQKDLFVTDLNSTQSRLSMPIKKIREDFLTEEEKRYFRGYHGINKNYKEVKIFEPSLATETAKFCRWDMAKKNGGKTSSHYIINGTWNDIVRRNKLRVGTRLQVWSFRVDGDLGFALVRLPTNQPQTSAA